jgi:hypothetical protein
MIGGVPIGIDRLRSLDIGFEIGLAPSADNSGLSLDISTLPAILRAGIEDIETIPLPLDFLEQRVTAPDGEAVDLFTATPRLILLKVVDGNLILGVDVELAQDEDNLVSHGFVRDPDLEESGAMGGTPRLCRIPEQPAVDPAAFGSFEEILLDGNDWVVALDAHLIDAIVRGSPSMAINALETPTAECEHEGGIRFTCLRLRNLDDNLIRLAGDLTAFSCTDSVDDWFVICIDVDVHLERSGSQVIAHYNLTGAEFCGSDSGWNDWADAFAEFPDDKRSGDVPLFESVFFGRSDSALGRLEVIDIRVQATGVVLRGDSHLVVSEARIDVPDHLLFAPSCEPDGRMQSSFLIVSYDAPLHVCPLMMNGEHRERFSIVGPRELQPGGGGLTVVPGRPRRVTVELDGEVGQNYVAELEIPNNAALRAVKLIGDLRPASARVRPSRLQLTRTDYKVLCADEFPPIGRLTRSVTLTNSGPGNLRVCSVYFPENAENPDGLVVFSSAGVSPGRILDEGASVRIPVAFHPGVSGLNRTFEGQMRIETTEGSFDVRLTGRIDRRTDFDDEPVIGSFAGGAFAGSFADAYGFFCGFVDWRRIGPSGILLDSPAFAELIPILGGGDCCPPPRLPACLCVEMLEIVLRDVPDDVELAFLNNEGRAIAANRSQLAVRTIFAPFLTDREYIVRADSLGQAAHQAPGSPLVMRRWILQQEGLHSTQQQLRGLAVAGDIAFATGEHGTELIDLGQIKHPRQVGLLPNASKVDNVAVWHRYLFVIGETTEVFSLADHRSPVKLGDVAVPELKALITGRGKTDFLRLGYGLGKRLHILDLTDPVRPRELGSVVLQGEAKGGVVTGRHLFVFENNGVEIFDLKQIHQPVRVKFLPTRQAVRTGFVGRSTAVLIYDSEHADLVDFSNPAQAQVAGSWHLEDWMKEFVPLAGSVIHHEGHFLILNGDQHGFRVVRMIKNHIDRKKLVSRRRGA